MDKKKKLIELMLLTGVLTCSALPPQRSDFLDNCDWCVKQSKVTQPLMLSDWMINCKRVPKPVWFNHRVLGRCYGTYAQLNNTNWLYTKQFKWVYTHADHDHHFYMYQHGWLYIRDNMVYDYVDAVWYTI